MSQKAIESIHVYRTTAGHGFRAVLVPLVTCVLLKKLYLASNVWDIIGFSVLFIVMAFLTVLSIYVFLWNVYREDKPILTLWSDALICDAIIHPITFTSFLGIKHDTSTTIFWKDIVSITVERGRYGGRHRPLELIITACNKTLSIELGDIDLPFFLLRQRFEPYKSIHIIDSGFMLTRFRLTKLYAKIYPWKNLFWIVFLIALLICLYVETHIAR